MSKLAKSFKKSAYRNKLIAFVFAHSAPPVQKTPGSDLHIDMLNVPIEGKRLKDIRDLPLDLAV